MPRYEFTIIADALDDKEAQDLLSDLRGGAASIAVDMAVKRMDEDNEPPPIGGPGLGGMR